MRTKIDTDIDLLPGLLHSLEIIPQRRAMDDLMGWFVIKSLCCDFK